MNKTVIKIKSFFTLLKKGYITPKKIVNMLLVNSSLLLKRPRVWGMPYSFSIEPTNHCNLKCPLCPTGKGTLKRGQGFLDFDLYKKVIDETGPYLFNVLLSIWGEPFLHKQIYPMIEYAKKKKIKTTIMTNGHFFNDKEKAKRLVASGVDRIILDLDGTNQKTLVKYRKNADFNKVVEGIKRIVKGKKIKKTKYPEIELQFVIMKHNEHQVNQMKKLASELGIDILIFKSARINNEEEAKEWLPKNKKFSRYDSGIKRNKKIKNKCDLLWTGGLIYWDGNVCPCCYDYQSQFILGNINEKSFKEIWNNPMFQAFRKQILKKKSKISLCLDCPGGDENFDLQRINIKKH